jgi:hypothetical protein
MFRFLIGLLLLTSCSMGVLKSGGERRYIYDPTQSYTLSELKEITPHLIEVSRRPPREGQFKELFGPKQNPIKRVGIITFESMIQPTWNGIAAHDKIYLSKSGKQLLTEELLKIWDEAFPILNSELVYLSNADIKASEALHKFGLKVDDYVKSPRKLLAPDDIFYLNKGKLTTTEAVLNPRGMRDLSFMMVPAYELMGGPKWSEHNKHFLNAIMSELKLDAAIIVMSKISWTSDKMVKNSDVHIPEEMNIELTSSLLVSPVKYHQRLSKLGNKTRPNVTLCYRSFKGELKVPVNLNFTPEEFNFETVLKEVLNPAVKSYKDLAIMMMEQMNNEIGKTHHNGKN